MAIFPVEYSLWRTELPDDSCPICSEPLHLNKNGQDLQVVGHNLPDRVDQLFHLIHENCLKEWQKTLAAQERPLNCPVCRAEISPPPQLPRDEFGRPAPFIPSPLPGINRMTDRLNTRTANQQKFYQYLSLIREVRAQEYIPIPTRWSVIEYATLELNDLQLAIEFLKRDEVPGAGDRRDERKLFRELCMSFPIFHPANSHWYMTNIENTIRHHRCDFLQERLRYPPALSDNEISHLLSECVAEEQLDMLDIVLRSFAISPINRKEAIEEAYSRGSRQMVERLLQLPNNEKIPDQHRGQIIWFALCQDDLSQEQRQIIVEVLLKDGPILQTERHRSLREARRHLDQDIVRAIINNQRRFARAHAAR